MVWKGAYLLKYKTGLAGGIWEKKKILVTCPEKKKTFVVFKSTCFVQETGAIADHFYFALHSSFISKV